MHEVVNILGYTLVLRLVSTQTYHHFNDLTFSSISASKSSIYSNRLVLLFVIDLNHMIVYLHDEGFISLYA